MKKKRKLKKLSRTSNQRKQLYRNLIRSLVMNSFLQTTEAKAKAVKPLAEKLVTLAKKGSLSTYRQLAAETGSAETAKGFLELGKLFKNRSGGYLRHLRISEQTGDNSQIIRLEWVEKLVKAEPVPVKNEPKKPQVDTKKQTVSSKPKKEKTEK